MEYDFPLLHSHRKTLWQVQCPRHRTAPSTLQQKRKQKSGELRNRAQDLLKLRVMRMRCYTPKPDPHVMFRKQNGNIRTLAKRLGLSSILHCKKIQITKTNKSALYSRGKEQIIIPCIQKRSHHIFWHLNFWFRENLITSSTHNHHPFVRCPNISPNSRRHVFSRILQQSFTSVLRPDRTGSLIVTVPWSPTLKGPVTTMEEMPLAGS